MATDDRLKQWLCEWGAWFNSAGAEAVGFPRKNILHPTWMPPAGGRLPEMAVTTGGSRARERMVHAAIGALSDKLIVAVVGKYARRMTSAQMALELCCTSSAVDGRIARAHDRLEAVLSVNY